MGDIKKNAEKELHAFPVADEAIENAKAKGEAMWNMAKTKGQELLDEVESGGQRAWTRVKIYVRSRPAQALGYAVLMGLAIGVFLSSKRRN